MSMSIEISNTKHYSKFEDEKINPNDLYNIGNSDANVVVTPPRTKQRNSPLVIDIKEDSLKEGTQKTFDSPETGKSNYLSSKNLFASLKNLLTSSPKQEENNEKKLLEIRTKSLEQEEKRNKLEQELFYRLSLRGLDDDKLVEAVEYVESHQVKENIEETINEMLEHLKKTQVANKDYKTTEPYFSPTKKKDLEQELMPKSKTVCCMICLENQNEEDMKKPLPCRHEFCIDCLRNYLTENIGNNKVLDLKCPDAECLEIFDDHQIQNLLPPEWFFKYKRYKKNVLLSRIKNLKWCPNNQCKRFVIFQEGMEKIKCRCGTEVCTKCGLHYHPNQSCQEFIEEGFWSNVKGDTIVKCPKCGHGVEKIEGCNHMTCAYCQYQWCWLCGGKYSRIHYVEENPFGCPGLSSGNHTRQEWTRGRIICLRIKTLILFLISPIIYLPLLIFWLALLPYLIIKRALSRINSSAARICKCLTLILSPLLLPITILGILISLCFVLNAFVGTRQRRRGRGAILYILHVLLFLLGVILLPLTLTISFFVGLFNIYKISSDLWRMLTQ